MDKSEKTEATFEEFQETFWNMIFQKHIIIEIDGEEYGFDSMTITGKGENTEVIIHAKR